MHHQATGKIDPHKMGVIQIEARLASCPPMPPHAQYVRPCWTLTSLVAWKVHSELTDYSMILLRRVQHGRLGIAEVAAVYSSDAQ